MVDEEKAVNSAWVNWTVCIAVLLVMLVQLQSAERHIAGSSSWLLKFDIAAPLLFGILFVIGLWKCIQRGAMTRSVARAVLVILGAILVLTYQAFDSLAIHWH